MSAELFPLNLEELARWIDKDLKKGTALGIPQEQFFDPRTVSKDRLFSRYGKTLETALGTAAGPHTQMSQNIAASWLCGGRFIELKTVQVLDELSISRPCIDMEDEGYNCEWSQELKLEQSFHQYLDAWVLLHALRVRLFGEIPKQYSGAGFIFNISVGYNLEGILSEPVQTFLARMRDAGEFLEEKLEMIAAVFPEVRQITIPSRLSDNVTLSTMHGCPPDEIEKIGRYLLEEQELHTTIKMNPTLLGPERLRVILNDTLGFDTEVPDEAFAHDLKYPDALEIISSLQDLAGKKNLEFGIKLSNTLESVNRRGIFPENEGMNYMSGRALYPITVNLAAVLAEELFGEIDISYAGGADCYSFPSLVKAGVWPVTVCSDILRPGGYGRLSQYMDELAACSSCVPDNTSGAPLADVTLLKSLAEDALTDPQYRKRLYDKGRSVKNDRPLPDFDCIHPPCSYACPVNQDVPNYMIYAAAGDSDRALEVIRRDNPLASVCGMVCEHPCEHACTRLNYDQPLAIRDIKRWAVNNGTEPEPGKTGLGENDFVDQKLGQYRVAVVGAGPAGLACAYELAVRGISVTVFEAAESAGGMVERVIPHYRLSRKDIKKDLKRLEELGVGFEYNAYVYDPRELLRDPSRDEPAMESAGQDNTPSTAVDGEDMSEELFDAVFVSPGAPDDKFLGIPGEDSDYVIGALEFLEETKRDDFDFSGSTISVVGGGNSAMDAARTALRLVGNEGEVHLIYRRTRDLMPADREEQLAVLEEGVILDELTQPVAVEETENIEEDASSGALSLMCIKMELSDPDETGRSRPVEIEGSEFVHYTDLLILAIGQEKDSSLTGILDVEGEVPPRKGMLFFGGDFLRGPSSIILSVSDGKRCAGEIISTLRGSVENSRSTTMELYGKSADSSCGRQAARRSPRIYPEHLPMEDRGMDDLVIAGLSTEQAMKEASRCLHCQVECNSCVTVCPNRANIPFLLPSPNGCDFPVYRLTGKTFEYSGRFSLSQMYQTLNITDLCNHCGNCTTFCPSAGRPFADSIRFAVSGEAFQDEENVYRFTGLNTILYREIETGTGEGNGKDETGDGSEHRLVLSGDNFIYQYRGMEITFTGDTWEICSVSLDDSSVPEGFTSERAVKMAILLRNLDEIRQVLPSAQSNQQG